MNGDGSRETTDEVHSNAMDQTAEDSQTQSGENEQLSSARFHDESLDEDEFGWRHISFAREHLPANANDLHMLGDSAVRVRGPDIVLQSRTPSVSHESQQQDGMGPEHYSSSMSPRLFPDVGSPASNKSLDLTVLDYLASNPFNLDLLIDDPWLEQRMNEEEMAGTTDCDPFPANSSTTRASLDVLEGASFNSSYKELHSDLHIQMVQTARNRALTRQGTPEVNSDHSGTNTPQPSTAGQIQRDGLCSTSLDVDDQSWRENMPITEMRAFELFQNYLDEICPWLDIFDNDNHWRTTVASMAQRIGCLHYALLALSARQQERLHPGKRHTESLILYQEAIRLMKIQMPTLCTEVIAASVLLCVLEMLCSSPRAWAKHLDGCTILLEAAGINGVVSGVRGALFWTFARMDVYRAFIDDTSTTLPIKRWFLSADSMSAAVRIFKHKPGSDSYANYAVFLCAGVVNILSNRRRSSHVPGSDAYSTFVSRWKAIYDLLDGWYKDRPEEMRPLMCVPPTKLQTQSAFSTILYSTPAGISSTQMHHASMILLLQDKPREVILPKTSKSMLWHARQICGISLSNSNLGALINALQPLWIAGQLMSHHSEHQAIIDVLEGVEKKTGWATSWRVKDLQECWGACDEA